MKKSVSTNTFISKLLTSILFSLMLNPVHGEVIKEEEKKQFTFPDWKKLHKLNADTMMSDAHRAWIDIYVNTIGKKAYEERWALFPIGSIVLKPLFPDDERSKILKLTVMIKMEKGYDAKHGDWWYGVYDETGMEVLHQGKIKSCIKCHARGKKTDYMFSESVMERIEDEM